MADAQSEQQWSDRSPIGDIAEVKSDVIRPVFDTEQDRLVRVRIYEGMGQDRASDRRVGQGWNDNNAGDVPDATSS